MDKLIKAMAAGGQVRAYAAITTDAVNTAAKLHNTSAVASAALGRALTAAAIMGGMEKNKEESVSLQFKGGGPIETVFAMSNGDAEIKGYVGNPYVELPLNKKGKLDVGGAVGRAGNLCVIRDFGKGTPPYVGQTRLATGEIGDDITFYYASSEQIPTAVGLGVLVDTDYSVKAAGGFIVSLLPGADDETITLVEEGLKNVTSVTELIEEGLSAEEILKRILPDIEILYEVTPVYNCGCSRERFERGIESLGVEEINGIIEDQGDAEVICRFCNKKYIIEKNRLLELAENARIKKEKKEKQHD